MREPICLCSRCLSDYLKAGYDIKRDYKIEIKDTCEKCSRLGWVYEIERNYGKTIRGQVLKMVES